MEPECALYDIRDSDQLFEEESESFLTWNAFVMTTDLVPMLLREVVHPAPQEEQFGRLLGLAVWLQERDVSILFNVVRPPAGQPPRHGTLLWDTSSSFKKEKASTPAMPEDAIEELWRLPAHKPWFRMIQPELARYYLSRDDIPPDNDARLHAAVVAWLNSPKAPVCLVKCRASVAGKDGLHPHVLDVSTWFTSLPPEDMAQGMRIFAQLEGERPSPLVDMLQRNGLQHLLPTLAQAQMADPSPARIARRQHDQLERNLQECAAPDPTSPNLPPRPRARRL